MTGRGDGRSLVVEDRGSSGVVQDFSGAKVLGRVRSCVEDFVAGVQELRDSGAWAGGEQRRNEETEVA